ncbi:hypothetical protein BDZ94DRAFT_1311912 [Collybia nuda]|uniref:Cdc24/Scd1 N-terminal domain-containing protein n=1 Tax=Collybia nuda TaxID=64659 RepID=A0A9P5Y070_9AGAR|nr:hypothetical protein BDZ94DRAFT_1311912 [Collybia nuda]
MSKLRSSPNPNLNETSLDDPATSPVQDARQSVIQDEARRKASISIRGVGSKRRPATARPSTRLPSYAAEQLASSKSGPVDRRVASGGPDEVDHLPPKPWGDPPPYTPRQFASTKRRDRSDPLVESGDSDEVEHVPSDIDRYRLRPASRNPFFPTNSAPVINSSLMEPDLLKSPSRSRRLVPRSHEKNTPTPNLYTGAAGTSVAGSSYSEESSRDQHTISISSGKISASIPRLSTVVPNAEAMLTFLCSKLLLRLTHICGFDFYFSLLPSFEGNESSDPISQVRNLFSLGIPLCYIFDLLPAEEGFAKINMSRFNTEEFAANPTREKNRAISFFITRLSSEQVRWTIPDCVHFSITDISGPPDNLIKVVNTVNAIIEYLPPDGTFTVSRAPQILLQRQYNTRQPMRP